MKNNITLRKFTYVIILGLFFSISGYGTHIKAGEFSARRLSGSSLSYEITLTLYYNTNGTTVDNDIVNIQFGDGDAQNVGRISKTNVGNNTTKNVFVVNHTYGGVSTYIVRMRDENRNGGIINTPGPSGSSSDVAFYVEMELKVNPLYGLNNSPIMSVPPIDFGNVGEIFTHNPGAYDPDGDSLSYELIPAKSSFNVPVFGYNYPASPIYGGTATTGGAAYCTLDPLTGDLVWNTPSNYGNDPRYYNIAMKITEWRFGRAIGYIVRDMQVEIFQRNNNPPKLTLPDDICIGAGKLLRGTITATDPDGDQVLLETFGQTYVLPSSPSTFTVSGSLLNPQGAFAWQTNCTHVRRQPYQVIFKATDQFKTPVLVDIQSWLIYVKGPKITGITTNSAFNSITLNWPLYACSNQAEKINIYRIDCDSVNPNTDPCKTGPLAGYTLIGSTPDAKATNFTDNNNGKGLDKGKSYSYILVAQYPAPGYGESFPSDQILASLNLDVPIFSSIDVSVTSGTAGEIFLKWYKPKAPGITAPYLYQLERAVGLNPDPGAFVPLGLPIENDTVYTDTNLDTKNSLYSYRIKLVNNGLYTSTIPVFDVTAKAGNALVNLSWKYEQPWSVDSVQIYRKINTGISVKIATVNGSAAAYTDNSVQNCDTVYYQVKQFGSYCDKLLTDIATAISAIDSVRPIDDTPLPAPALTVKGCNGDTSVYQNVLNWTSLYNATCNTLDHYNVYFSKHESDNINLLTTTNDITYIDKNKFTTAGCYVVSATNLSGVEGLKSAKICVDDCPYYKLPNLLTVNNDGRNDLIMPFPYPRGARYVRYSVYNRWGALVFFRDIDININWDGSIQGDFLSDGIYYYSAEVHYYGRLNPDDEVKTLKGWLQILTTTSPTK